MISKKIIQRIIFLLLLIIFSGCLKKPKGFGGDTALFVVADSTDWIILEPTFLDVFERTIDTPQPEKVFQVVWVPPYRYQEFATRKNLVFTGALQSDGEISRKITNMLAPEVKNKVIDGSAFFFPKENPWAKDQLLLVLVSNTLPELQGKMLDRGEYLYDLFETKLVDSTTRRMYQRLEQKDLAEELLESYGWSLRIQHDYLINIRRSQERFVMLRRSLPENERWLFVHWIENGDPNLINEAWIINKRNQLTQKYYQNDIINREHTHSKEIDFLNRKAVLLEGLWENDEKMAGGPFRNYSFYDEASGRIYMIDIAVFFPRGEKEPFLRQLDIMAHTFITAEQAGNETKKEAS